MSVSTFFLVDGSNAFSAWMADIALKAPLLFFPLKALHLIAAGQDDDSSPNLPCTPSMLQDIGLDARKDFSIFLLSVLCCTRRCRSSASKRPSRPSFPSVLYMAASRWKRRRRGRIGSTYVGKDVSISPLFAKWRLTSNENIAFSKIREAFYRIWTSAALHRHWCEQH